MNNKLCGMEGVMRAIVQQESAGCDCPVNQIHLEP